MRRPVTHRHDENSLLIVAVDPGLHALAGRGRNGDSLDRRIHGEGYAAEQPHRRDERETVCGLSLRGLEVYAVFGQRDSVTCEACQLAMGTVKLVDSELA